MLKRILILLGETQSSTVARQYAFRLAHISGAEVAGLAGVDLAYIESPVLGGIGTAAYKFRLEEQLKAQADEIRQRLHETFKLECAAQRLPFELLSFDGDPIVALLPASESRDLVVAGHDATFRGNLKMPRSEVLAELLWITPRPVIICPDEVSATEEILIAYDSSVPAMRAVQVFALLEIGQGKRIHVTSVDRSQQLAAKRTESAASYLRCHGYQVETNPIASRAYPAEVLNREISERSIGMLVMGAYGRRRIREFLFGSTTKTLIESPRCALFMYH